MFVATEMDEECAFFGAKVEGIMGRCKDFEGNFELGKSRVECDREDETTRCGSSKTAYEELEIRLFGGIKIDGTVTIGDISGCELKIADGKLEIRFCWERPK
ncbi:hypothetical protein U1Q18_011009 [Sarracenia purpurea var. burkii]